MGGGNAPAVAGEVTETAGRGEHDKSNINVTEDRQFIGFLNEAIAPFGEGHLPVCVVFYPFYLKLNSSHYNYLLIYNCINL